MSRTPYRVPDALTCSERPVDFTLAQRDIRSGESSAVYKLHKTILNDR
jgi:hypothetical protein